MWCCHVDKVGCFVLRLRKARRRSKSVPTTHGCQEMNREYHKWHSANLNRDMELLVFGHSGARVLVFPTSCGRFYDWENREMVKTLSHHIDQGLIQLFCVDSVDAESWWNMDAHPKDK